MAETAPNAVEPRMDWPMAEPAVAQPLVLRAPTAAPIAEPVAAQAIITARARPKTTAVGGAVVPPGTLTRNAHHPLLDLRPEQRSSVALEALGRLVLRLRDQPWANTPSGSPKWRHK